MNRPDPDLQRPTGTTAPENDASVMGLLRQLTHEVPSLFTKELALAKAEFQASLNSLKAGIAGVAGGAMVLLAGFIILLMAVVYGLSTMMAPWLAALIVGFANLPNEVLAPRGFLPARDLGKLPGLLGELALRRLELVVSDVPLPGNLGVRAFSHLLGRSAVAFFGAAARIIRSRDGPATPEQAWSLALMRHATRVPSAAVFSAAAPRSREH